MNYEYKCNATGYLLRYHYNGDGYLITFENIDHKNVKALVSLVVSSVVDLLDKDVKFVYQYVMRADWNEFKGDFSWKIVEEHDGVCLVKCETGEYVNNYVMAIGLETL